MAEVKLEGVRKVYDNGFVAVAGASFEVADGELLVLVGPSGCGKSTLLRLIAGLETITSGRLTIGGRVVNEVPPKDRDIAMVFQSYALYPHKTVAENLAFGLTLRGTPKAEVAARVARAADLLEIGAVLDRKPKQLSGGQRQRVALGRAIVREPAVFLLDEPLSNLDAKLRLHMRTEIAKLHQRLGTTMIYVTHDQIEAMTLGNRIAVMKGGEIQQIAPPMEVYREPANLFVAGFLGSPAMNVLCGPLIRDWVPKAHAGRELLLGIRPEDVHWVRDETTPGPQLTVQLEVIEPIGSEAFLHARLENTPLVARIPPHPLPRAGETITLSLDLGKAHWFDAGTERRVG